MGSTYLDRGADRASSCLEDLIAAYWSQSYLCTKVCRRGRPEGRPLALKSSSMFVIAVPGERFAETVSYSYCTKGAKGLEVMV